MSCVEDGQAGADAVAAVAESTSGPDSAAWLVGAVVTAGMVLGSAGGPSFLDSGELIAAARELGGVHPPGHPAWLSLAGLAEVLPFGAYGARVVWLSALFAGIAAGLLVRIARGVMGPFGATRAGGWWAAAAGLALGCSGSLWQVGVRAEVYTLALATNLWAIDAALRAGRAAKGAKSVAHGPAAEVVVALALGLLNHHYVTLFALPAVLLAGWPALRTLPRKHLAALVGAGAFAGLGYLALPLRALADTEMRWGDPTTLQGVWRAVTAQHFQRSVTAANVDLMDNAMVLMGAVSEGMGVWLAAAGLLGLGVAVLRPTGAWAATCAALVGGLLTKAFMVIDTHNPDDHGYVLLVAAALALGLAHGAAVLFGEDGVFAGLPQQRRRWLATLVVPWLVLLAGLGFALRTTSPATWQAGQRGPDAVDTLVRSAVGPGGIYLSNYYGLQFNEAAWRVAEGRRPDILSAHLSFRTGDTDGGVGYARWFAKRYPAEASLALGAVKMRRAPVGNLLQLAEAGRVYAEEDPDLRLPTAMLGFGGVAHRLLSSKERTLEYDLAAEQRAHERVWQALYDQLGPVTGLDHQTKGILVWQHALQMAHALRRGWRVVARDELARARKLAPSDSMLNRLEARLQLLDGAWKDGDVKRFHRLWQGYASMDLSALAAPVGGAK